MQLQKLVRIWLSCDRASW